MKKLFTISLLSLFLLPVAHADVWKWVDASGKTHFVDTNTAIFTWTDDGGDVHYSDTPDHEDAVAVQLVWHSSGTLEEMTKVPVVDGGVVEETEGERLEREQAEAHYCKRVSEIHNSYVNAPRLYRTNEKGEREYLSKKEAQQMIAETTARQDEFCK